MKLLVEIMTIKIKSKNFEIKLINLIKKKIIDYNIKNINFMKNLFIPFKKLLFFF